VAEPKNILAEPWLKNTRLDKQTCIQYAKQTKIYT
jgi:hypothetical protein